MKLVFSTFLFLVLSSHAHAVQNCDLTNEQLKQAVSAGGNQLYQTVAPELEKNGVVLAADPKGSMEILETGFSQLGFNQFSFQVADGTVLLGRANLDYKAYVDVNSIPLYDAAGNYSKCQLGFDSFILEYVMNVETSHRVLEPRVVVPAQIFFQYGPNK